MTITTKATKRLVAATKVRKRAGSTTRTTTRTPTTRAPTTRAPTTRAPATPELSHETIRVTALQLIDSGGLASFSTRRLGAALGCEAMAIYWYYPSKDALLDAIVDELMADVARVIGAVATGDAAKAATGAAARDAAGAGAAGAAAGASARRSTGGSTNDWIDTLRTVAHAYRRLAHDHPNAFPLLAMRRFASEGTYTFLERLFTLARQHGIDDRVSARFYRVVSSYCNGFALNELASPSPQDPRTAGLRKRFPAVAAVSMWLDPKYLDEMFELGLELQLAALTRVTRTARER